MLTPSPWAGETPALLSAEPAVVSTPGDAGGDSRLPKEPSGYVTVIVAGG